MDSKEYILGRFRRNVGKKYDMPDLGSIAGITYPDPLVQFINITQTNGSNLFELKPGDDINKMIMECYPDAETVASARDLDGTDVGVVRAELGVAENGCMWVPQQCKEKVVDFISENLVILLPRDSIVNNMHEAYRKIKFNSYNFGTFIAGASKTADIAQVLVVGAQAARSCTIFLV